MERVERPRNPQESARANSRLIVDALLERLPADQRMREPHARDARRFQYFNARGDFEDALPRRPRSPCRESGQSTCGLQKITTIQRGGHRE